MLALITSANIVANISTSLLRQLKARGETMSTSVYYHIPKPIKGKYLGNYLKDWLRENHNGTAILSEGDIPFLRGVMVNINDEEMKAAFESAIEDIEKHGQIEVYIN